MTLSPDFVPVNKPNAAPISGMSPDFVPVAPKQAAPSPLDDPTLMSLLPVEQDASLTVPEPSISTPQALIRQGFNQLVPGVGPILSMGDQNANGALGTANLHGSQSALSGFRDEMVGARNTLADAVTGNIPHTEGNNRLQDAWSQYTYNRDLERKRLEVSQEKNPMSAFMGTLAGSAPWMLLPLGGVEEAASLAGNLGPSAMRFVEKMPALASHLIQTGQISALGGLMGVGMSESDMIKNPMGVINDGLSMALKTGALYQAIPVLRYLSNPKELTLLGGVKALSGGGDANKGLNVAENSISSIVKGTPVDQTSATKGLQLMINEGKMALNNNVITNIESKNLGGSNFLKNPAQQGVEYFRRLLSKNPQSNLLDMPQALRDVSGQISQRANEADSLLKQAFSKRPIDPVQVFGTEGGANKTQQLLSNITTMKQNLMNESALLPGDSGAFESMAKTLSKPKLTYDDLVNLKQQLGDVIGSKVWSQGAKPGSVAESLMNDYFAIRQFLQDGVASLGKVAGRKFGQLQDEMSNLLALKGHIVHGLTPYTNAAADSSNFIQAPIQKGMAELSKANGGGGNIVQWLGGMLGKGGQLAGKAAEGVTTLLTRPGASAWLNQVFPSYDPEKNKLKSEQDIALYNHYVDTLNIDSRQKSRLKIQANTDGSVQSVVVPKAIKEQAISRLGYAP